MTTVPQGQTNLNVSFDAQFNQWVLKITRNASGVPEVWEVELDHRAMREFSDGLIELLDRVECDMGSKLRH
jgi:hypothetical protein